MHVIKEADDLGINFKIVPFVSRIRMKKIWILQVLTLLEHVRIWKNVT